MPSRQKGQRIFHLEPTFWPVEAGRSVPRWISDLADGSAWGRATGGQATLCGVRAIASHSQPPYHTSTQQSPRDHALGTPHVPQGLMRRLDDREETRRSAATAAESKKSHVIGHIQPGVDSIGSTLACCMARFLPEHAIPSVVASAKASDWSAHDSNGIHEYHHEAALQHRRK